MRGGLVARSRYCRVQARPAEPVRDERGEMSEWIIVAGLAMVAFFALIALVGVVTGWSPIPMVYTHN